MKKRLSFICHARNTIKDVFLSRGYTEISSSGEEDDAELDKNWNFLWSTRSWLRTHLLGNPPIPLLGNQMINHFPKAYELTRKDLMFYTLQRRSRVLRKEGQEVWMDFTPETLVLPIDIVRLRDEMKNGDCVWICKPAGGSMGQGIELITSLNSLNTFENKLNAKLSNAANSEDRLANSYVAQKYIANPLLVGGRKFDMRLYALTLSLYPLVVYIHRGGFCRLSSQPFTMDTMSKGVHLTNVAIQTHQETYNQRHGGKWDTRSLRQYLRFCYGDEETNDAFAKVQAIMINSLMSIESELNNDSHSYELFGYDILFDETLRPWLIEVNGSPSLDANTEEDYDNKFSMLNEMLDLVLMFRERGRERLPLQHGGFDLVWNGGPINSVLPTSYQCRIGCVHEVNGSPNNPYRTNSKFTHKKIRPIPNVDQN